MSFEWRTDEDKGWKEPIKSDKSVSPPSLLRRRWRFLLVALLGVAAVWGVVQWQINQRVTAATVLIESELLNTHNFVLQTAVDQDEDLFKANLSGRDPAWGEVQKTLLDEGLLLDRPMLGWQHEVLPEQLSLEDLTIELDPTLTAAELKYPQTYSVQSPSGVTETVTLQQTAVYRLGTRRWLYSPPLNEFWGDWITQGGDYLTVAYTERDRDVVARLGIDLDHLLGQMCAELADLNCASDLRVHLRFNTEPESLLEINEIESMLTAGLRLELPTPTLIGLPTDDASYELLYRAYGVQLVTAVLAHQIEYDCCRHQLFFRALRDYQLAQLGLQAWPLEETMFNQMLSAGFDGHIMRHWTRRWEEAPPQFIQVYVIEESDPIWQQVYMLVEYLNEQETAVSPTEMMRLMNRNSYNGWLADVLPDSYDDLLFETRFLEYIYAQSSGGQQAEPPIPFPNGEITMICNGNVAGFTTHVYAFDFVSQTWREKFTDMDISSDGYLTTYDGKNFILSESSYADPDTATNRFYLVTEGSKLLLEEANIQTNLDHYISYFSWNGPDNYLVRYEYMQGDIMLTFRSLDCPTEDCPQIQLAGFPTPSPNGQYYIEDVAPAQAVQGLGQELPLPQDELSVVSFDGEFRQPLGQGGFGFWIDNETYGFVQAGDDGWELVISSLAQQRPQILLHEADLLAEIPSGDRESALLYNNIFAIPNTNDLVLQVGVGDGPRQEHFLFRLHLADDFSSVPDIELLWKGSFAGTVGYSPDGRYIIIADYNFASSGGEFPHYLLDLETGQISENIIILGWYGISWSPDGQWFLQNTETYLLLHAPAYDYQYYIPHGLGNCLQAALSVDE